MTKLLVIEDEKPLLEQVVQILQYRGFDVIGALDGMAGVELARTYQPQLIISDIRMPELDGYGVLRAIRSDPNTANTPFIFLTARVEREDFRQGMALGADDYVTKPFDYEELVQAIETRLERQEFYYDLQQRLRAVSQSDQRKSDLMRMAAHDLRNPVHNIGLTLNLLRRQGGVDLRQNGLAELDDIATSVDHIQAIIDDFLSVERLETTGTWQPVNLSALAADSYRLFEPQARAKNQFLDAEISADDITVQADAALLREAIHNLLANAIKYTPEGGQIVMRVARTGRICRLTVEDNGYGVPEDQLDQLFQPSYRAQTPETAEIEGSGLGLHLVKSIITQHQGEVLVQSVYGQGSLFGFFLPVSEPRQNTSKIAPPPQPAAHHGLINRLIGRVTNL
jgi:two-component system, sensor histidine kinase and response regulator